MVVAARIGFVTLVVAAILSWDFGFAWLWPLLAGAACLALIASALLDDGSTTSGRKLRRPALGGLKALKRGVTDNHGHADWLSVGGMRAQFPGPAPAYGGVVVGEAYRVDQQNVAGIRFDPRNKRTWGKGGRAPLLIDPCTDGPTHSMIFAGPGSFKTTSAVSTLLHWTGSSVVLDPSCELGPILEDALVKQGKRVHHVGINSARDAARCGINVLAWIDPQHAEAEMHVRTAVSWIYDEDAAALGGKNDDPFFMPMGKELVTCLLAHMLWDERVDPSEKNLQTLRVGIEVPEAQMPGVLKGIQRTSHSPMARKIASTLMDVRAPETFSGIYANAVKGTSWLSVTAYGAVVSNAGLDMRELLDGDTTVFLQVPLQTLLATPALGRVLVGALLNVVYFADGNINGRVLFLLDEAARLGRMKVLEVARDVGRKYGITLQLLYQSMGQLVDQWGREGKRAWFDAVSWVGFAAIQDWETAREVSSSFGNHGVMAWSEGDNSGRQMSAKMGMGSRSRGTTTSEHEIKRALMTPDELMHDARTDEMFVLARGQKPIRCGRAIYFRRPELSAQVGLNRFAA